MRLGRARGGAAPVDEASAIRFRVLGVHGSGGDGARLARSVRGPVLAADEGEGPFHDEQTRVEVVRVRLPACVRLDLTLADLVAFLNSLTDRDFLTDPSLGPPR